MRLASADCPHGIMEYEMWLKGKEQWRWKEMYWDGREVFSTVSD
jgi:hypothetical protein